MLYRAGLLVGMALYRLAYGRVSTDSQSLDQQLANFERLGFDELFVEKLSGRKRDRPEFAKLLARAAELRKVGHDVIILCNEWTRWARDTAFALDSLDQLEKLGCTVLEATTGAAVTVQTPDGLITTGLKSLVAHEFSVRLSDRMTRSYQHRQATGRPASNRAPFGYRYESGGFVPSEQWAIARDSVERYMQGEATSDIIRWLWREHAIKRSVNGFNQWLRHPILRGHLRYPDGSMLFNVHEALISEGEYQQIKRRLELNRSLRGHNKGRIHAIPNGIVRCDGCGKGTVPSISNLGRKHRYFYCPDKVGMCAAPRQGARQDWVEAAIQEAIQERAEWVVNRILDGAGDSDPRLIEKQQELEALQPLAHRPAIAAEIEAIALEIEQIKSATQQGAADAQEREAMIVDLAGLLPGDWAQLSSEERRDLYAYLVREVRVLGAEVVGVVLW